MCPGDTIAEYMKEPQSGVVYYVASQTNPVILGRMKGRAVFLFHAYQHGYAGLMQEFGRLGKLPLVHGGGSHAGLRAIYFARLIRGITDIHVFGLDASFADGEHHAGEQFLLDSCEIECEGGRSAPCPHTRIRSTRWWHWSSFAGRENHVLWRWLDAMGLQREREWKRQHATSGTSTTRTSS